MTYPQIHYLLQKVPKQFLIFMICFNIYDKMSFRTPPRGVLTLNLRKIYWDVWLLVTLFAVVTMDEWHIQFVATTVRMPRQA